MKCFSLFISLTFLLTPVFSETKEAITILILSGSNNHNWEQTTKQLEELFSAGELFSYEITLRPDTLKKEDLTPFSVVLSNWNSWPDTEKSWPVTTRQAILEFIRAGGGFVTFHASTSAFYDWPEFKRITTAAWIADKTYHGEISETEVNVIKRSHPVTDGITGFHIFDELWTDAEINPGFEVLGTATNVQLKKNNIAEQPAIMVSHYGRGRIFHTILGHDARAMRNTGFKQLLLRGTEWAATGKVTQLPARELQSSNDSLNYSWHETDSTVRLVNGNDVIWQYNFNTKYGRPFFHPVFINRNNLTCLSPDDHRWHLGQWFCWKYINKVNYWEYHRGPFQSEGVTEVENIRIKKNADFSAEFELEIVYYPFGGKKVMAEKRNVKVSPPQPDGKLWMDYHFIFEALADEVELDRTPVLGEENGQSWGGYAGLSIRFSQNFMNPGFITSGNDDNVNGSQSDWLYMGFTGIDGGKVGSQIMVPSEGRRNGWAWYSVNDGQLPFYYFSPAYLYHKPLILKKGEKIKLSYRILHLPGEVNADLLNEEFQKYINQ
jgi:type 1 glutamine amidotransferase